LLQYTVYDRTMLEDCIAIYVGASLDSGSMVI
jgi:hypothetical protein